MLKTTTKKAANNSSETSDAVPTVPMHPEQMLGAAAVAVADKWWCALAEGGINLGVGLHSW